MKAEDAKFRLGDQARADVVRAIGGHLVTEVVYEGGARVVHPHTLYVAKDGNELLLVWQVGGFSSSGDLPGWRNLLTEKFEEMTVTDEHFDPRSDAEVQRKGLGDIVVMATV